MDFSGSCGDLKLAVDGGYEKVMSAHPRMYLNLCFQCQLWAWLRGQAGSSGETQGPWGAVKAGSSHTGVQWAGPWVGHARGPSGAAWAQLTSANIWKQLFSLLNIWARLCRVLKKRRYVSGTLAYIWGRSWIERWAKPGRGSPTQKNFTTLVPALKYLLVSTLFWHSLN